MAFKITFTIFVVVYVSILQAHKSDGSSQVGGVEDLLEQLRIDSFKALIGAAKRLESSEKRVVDWSARKIKFFENRMEETTELWTNYLTLLEERAKRAKVTTEVCVGNNKTTLNDLTKKFNQEVESDLHKTLEKAPLIVKDSLAQLQKTVDDTVAEYEEEIAACGSGSTSAKCLEGVAARLRQQILVLPKSIEHQAIIHSSQITQLILEALEYSNEKFHKSKSQGNAIVEEIEKCVEKEIHK